jgi:Acetyltransferase (GNAT) domain
MDRATPAGHVPPGYVAGSLPGFELRLDRDDDELLAAMSSMARRNVRTAARHGVVVEVVTEDLDGFAAEYYRQALPAFARRGRRPSYPVERVQAALRHLTPGGHVVALRACAPDGTPVASGIFPGLPGGAAVLWMVAGTAEAQRLRANERLVWEALRTWRDRGARTFDFGGGGEHKAKYGGTPIEVPWLRCSRVAALEQARELTRRLGARAVRVGRVR